MREATPTRSTAIELADERKLMRQGYDFLDEKRMLLAAEMLHQLRLYEERTARLIAAIAGAAEALAAAVERHGLDRLQVEPPPQAPAMPGRQRASFLGLVMLSLDPPSGPRPNGPTAIDPSPELEACRAAFDRLVWAAADLGVRAGNLGRLAREYRRTERRARALEKVLLPEVEDAMRRIDEQLDTMDREDVIRGRRSRTIEATEMRSMPGDGGPPTRLSRRPPGTSPA